TWACSRGVTAVPWRSATPITGEVIVDALLGTGLQAEVRGPYRDAIAVINGAGRPVLAVDIPSGLDSDTGIPRPVAVAADLTVTFIGVKQGLLTGSGPDHCGDLHFDDLGVTPEIYAEVPCAGRRL